MTDKNSGVTLRPARLEDGERVFEWRNASVTRKYSRNPTPLSLKSHLRWWEASLGDPSRILLIAETAAMAVGVIRFDVDGSSAEISIYLDPDQRARGLGPATLAAGSAWIGAAREQVTRLTAVISDENAASLRAFEKAGFRRAGNVWICEIGGSARVSRVEG